MVEWKNRMKKEAIKYQNKNKKGSKVRVVPHNLDDSNLSDLKGSNQNSQVEILEQCDDQYAVEYRNMFESNSSRKQIQTMKQKFKDRQTDALEQEELRFDHSLTSIVQILQARLYFLNWKSYAKKEEKEEEEEKDEEGKLGFFLNPMNLVGNLSY